MTAKQQHAATASASGEFSFKLTDDDDGLSTLKRNVAKSGLLSGQSTLQRMPESLPETIAEKERAVELDDVERLEEEEATTTYKMPLHLLTSNGFEKIEEFPFGEDIDHDCEKSTYFSLPSMPHSISNPSLHSTASEIDAHGTSFGNPLFTKEDAETRF